MYWRDTYQVLTTRIKIFERKNKKRFIRISLLLSFIIK